MALPSPGEPAHGQKTAPILGEEQSLLFAALETTLARALAISNALQLAGEPSPAYPTVILTHLDALRQRAGLRQPTTTTPTYASAAAKPAPTMPSADHRSATKPSAAEHSRPEPATAPLTTPRKPKRKNSHHRPTRRGYQRLIVRWLGTPPDPSSASLDDICTRIGAALGDYRIITGSSWTPAKNLALYVRAPYTAAQLLLRSDEILDGLGQLWQIEDDALLELDSPWSNVVVRNVPVDAYLDGWLRMWDQLDALGYPRSDICAIRPMVKNGILEGSGLKMASFKISFRDAALASRMVTEGVALYDAYCRVVPYRG
uniref:Uncharacterized protein n=1 Tax=Mycena chlorophos TaxID=658473 RepID=A0ABQ0LLS0_MYCCL|nr:predicted protein [Mycena chlorophos]